MEEIEETNEQVAARLWRTADNELRGPQGMPVWVLCKMIWRALNGHTHDRVQLYAPYKISPPE